MKITGKTVSRPMLDDMLSKYRGLFQKLQNIIDDDVVFGELEHHLIELEWCDFFYDLINVEHGGNLPIERQEAEYERFYESILKQTIKLRSYLYCEKGIKLNIPSKQSDTHKKLKELLVDYPNALQLIYEFYPFKQKRSNAREINNNLIVKALDRIENKDKYIKTARWIHIKPVKDKEFIFNDVDMLSVLTLKDDEGNDYFKFEEIIITNIDETLLLTQDTDYSVSNWGTVQFLSPLVEECKDIKITITTEALKFKRI